jgi:hypothetical protein
LRPVNYSFRRVHLNFDLGFATEVVHHMSEGVFRERRVFVFQLVVEKKFSYLLERFPLLFAGFVFEDLAVALP